MIKYISSIYSRIKKNESSIYLLLHFKNISNYDLKKTFEIKCLLNLYIKSLSNCLSKLKVNYINKKSKKDTKSYIFKK